MNEPRTRTLKQNAALHKFFALLADALNDAGLDQRVVFEAMREGVEIPWNEATVKENLYKPILEAMTGKTSTTEMDTVDPSEVYNVLHRWLSSKGFPCPDFPSYPPTEEL